MAQNGQGSANNAVGGSNDGATQVSSMPLPPMHYVNEYTDEALRRGTAPLPPPPIMDTYSMFGQPFSSEDCIVASLESQGIRRLYSAKEVDRKRELRKLNHSALVNFLDLLDILIKTPDSQKREEKIEDLNLIFIHMHHLVNEFRPHQARETLRVMLHVQKKRRLLVSEKFAEVLEKVKDQIRDGLEALPDVERDEMNDGIEYYFDDKSHLQGNFTQEDRTDLSLLDTALCGVADIYNV